MRAVGFVPHTIDRDHRSPGRDGPAADWAKRLLVEAPGQRRLNLHVPVEGRPNQRYPLLFRDYLRAHLVAATSYATLKRRPADLSLRRASTRTSRTP